METNAKRTNHLAFIFLIYEKNVLSIIILNFFFFFLVKHGIITEISQGFCK